MNVKNDFFYELFSSPWFDVISVMSNQMNGG